MTDHRRHAIDELERADAILNRDGKLEWEYRLQRATLHTAAAQVHATLAAAAASDAIAEILETKTISVSGWIGDRNAI